jgi:hypothetical protein
MGTTFPNRCDRTSKWPICQSPSGFFNILRKNHPVRGGFFVCIRATDFNALFAVADARRLSGRG